MAPSPIGTIVAAALCTATFVVGARATGPVPALGRLLDPAHGVWTAVYSVDLPENAAATIPGMQSEVRVTYDDRAVPHLFAANSADAYRALGYVVARDRLFQLEIQGRSGAGTLSELAGPGALSIDRETRASGMPRAAEQRLAQLDRNDAEWQLVQWYVDGVNAYIDQLAPADYPIEYKLLGRAPHRMEVIDVLHLLNRMGATLATTRDELTHLQASAKVGRLAADALFPVHAPIVEPIQPNGQRAPRFDESRIPPPGAPDGQAVSLLRGMDPATMLAFASRRLDDAIGSNNWAVAPQRTAAGHALLAGDPHLELTLPSIWYEAHLVVHDSLDVYGVTIPGAPGVVIGFTNAVAWTFTNTGGDVMDYYVEQVNDSIAPTAYMLDGAWQPVELRAEAYHDAHGRVIARDTIRFTHRGPLRKVGAQWISVRWTVLETTRGLDAFDGAARAHSSAELLRIMAERYQAPAQNMLTIDTSGAIGIRSTGRYPTRPSTAAGLGNDRGDWLTDGTRRSNDWLGDWPVQDYPQSLRPQQGYLASANQEPFDPRVQPRYFGAQWERPWRAMRINALLRADSALTPDKMREFQSDPGSARADLFVPAFLAAAQGAPPDAKAAQAGALLAEWDRRYTTDNRRAVLFEEMMRQLSVQLWDEFRDPVPSPVPNDMMSAMLLRDAASGWWDARSTATIESRDELLRQIMATALDTTVARHGAATSEGWRWSNVRHANILHLTRLPAFSRLNIPVQGGSATLWPSTGDGHHGPSWRMVVEMSNPRRAWAIYPGGQSGNPLSARYADRIDRWALGQLDTLRLPLRESDLPAAQRRATLTLTGTPNGDAR